MPGRGRGRMAAANKMPIPMSSIGLNRNEINQNVITPPELYPPTFFRTIKIEPEEVDLFLIGVKQQLRTDFKSSQYHIKEKKDQTTIDRYSDKYETILNQPTNEIRVWNYKVFPDELKPRVRTKTKEATAKTAKKVTFDELKTKLEKLENNENNEEENVEDEEEDNEEEQEAGQVEEDIEEETDYAMSYFDNGEDYLNESDDNLGDEATF